MRVARVQGRAWVRVSPTRTVSRRSGQDWDQLVSSRTVRGCCWVSTLPCVLRASIVLLSTPQLPKARSSVKALNEPVPAEPAPWLRAP